MSQTNDSKWTTKKVSISGLTQGMRKADFERKKDKMAKSGWEGIELHDDGMSNSYAIFRRPLDYKEEPFKFTKQHIIGGTIAFVLITAMISGPAIANLFGIALLIALLLLVVGLIKPAAVKLHYRKQVWQILGGALAVNFIALAIAVPKLDKKIEEKDEVTVQKVESPTIAEQQPISSQPKAQEQPEEPKWKQYQNYIERLTAWTDQMDQYHRLAMLSSQETKDPVQLYQDVDLAQSKMFSNLYKMPSNPDSETEQLYNAVLRTYTQRYEAWKAMKSYVEENNVKNLANFKQKIQASEQNWKQAVTRLSALKLKVKELKSADGKTAQ